METASFCLDDKTVQGFVGGLCEGGTPVPIPNTEVKPLSADGTALVTVWESRTPPTLKFKAPDAVMVSGAFFVGMQ